MTKHSSKAFPQRILFISHGPMLYGAQRSLLALLAGINREQYSPYLLVPREGPLTDEVKALNIPVFISPLKHWVAFGQEAKKNWSARAFNVINGLNKRVCIIADLISEHDIHIVYTNTVTCIEGALAARKTGRPHLWHLREHVAGNKDLKALLTPSIISRTIGSLSAHVIVNSKALGKAYSCPALSAKTTVVYNGISLGDFDREKGGGDALRKELGLNENTKIIASIASLTPRKGYGTFIEAASKIKASFTDVTFLAIGEGERDFVNTLKKKVALLDLNDNFYFLGWRSDVNKILEGVDLLIIPCEQEAFGRTVVEAMAAGVPVVSTRCGGPEEIIVDNETGFLVPLNDPDSIAKAAIRILNDTNIATRFIEAGQARASALFNLDVYIKGIESVLENLANSASNTINTQPP